MSYVRQGLRPLKALRVPARLLPAYSPKGEGPHPAGVSVTGIIDTSQPMSLINPETVKDLNLPLERQVPLDHTSMFGDTGRGPLSVSCYRVRISIPDYLMHSQSPFLHMIWSRSDIEFDLYALSVSDWPRIILREPVHGHRGLMREQLDLPRTVILGMDFLSRIHMQLDHHPRYDSTLNVAPNRRR